MAHLEQRTMTAEGWAPAQRAPTTPRPTPYLVCSDLITGEYVAWAGFYTHAGAESYIARERARGLRLPLYIRQQ